MPLSMENFGKSFSGMIEIQKKLVLSYLGIYVQSKRCMEGELHLNGDFTCLGASFAKNVFAFLIS